MGGRWRIWEWLEGGNPEGRSGRSWGLPGWREAVGVGGGLGGAGSVAAGCTSHGCRFLFSISGQEGVQSSDWPHTKTAPRHGAARQKGGGGIFFCNR